MSTHTDSPIPKRAAEKSSQQRPWQNKQWRYAALNSDCLYHGANRYGIPDLLRAEIDQLPEWLAPFTKRLRTKEMANHWVHFFLDDYQFEVAWRQPGRVAQALKKRNRPVLTPDFSIYEDWPLALQLWNTYRSRWCGAFWQQSGLTVIPTVCWGTYLSFDFCFLGIPKGSIVAISAQGAGVKQLLEEQFFLEGFYEMVRRLDPSVVLAYGKLPAGCYDVAEIVEYPTDWQTTRKLLADKADIVQRQKQIAAADR
ncbi:MAG: DUF4417 domain-containing protein [Anaerolineales bacterium]|nr:DUF4417 domain-containing protein [Anaerolineales bacterium]MCB0017667.1 DUF4417 domain-containing protein [Anaerolineales bacterium]MCB0026456.1 DUF4417 domain-containing protein [Anaerolineales bacterium]